MNLSSKYFIFVLITWLNIGCSSISVEAQEIPNFDLEQIIITASPLSQEEQKEASIISTKVIKPGNATNVADLLSDIAGIDVKRKASIGDNRDTVKLRGFDASRFVVTVDGCPANAAGVIGGGFIDWSTFPLDNVEKVEVIRGAKSAIYGNTLGGVINIVTKKGTAKPFTSIQTIYGSKNMQKYQLIHTGSTGNFSYAVTMGKMKRDAYLLNNYFDSEDYSLKTTYTFTNKGELTLGIQSNKTKRGYIVNNRRSSDPDSPLYNEPADPTYPASDGDTIAYVPNWGPNRTGTPNVGAYWDKIKYYYEMTYRQPTQDGSWKIQAFKNYENRDDYNYDLSGKLVFDRTSGLDRSYGWSFQQIKNKDKHRLTYGLEQKKISYGNVINNYVAPGWPSFVDHLTAQKLYVEAAYLQDEYKANDNLSYLFGFRYDQYRGRPDINTNPTEQVRPIDGRAISPKFEVNYQFDPQTIGYLSLNRGYRVPTLAEHYWWSVGDMRNYPEIDLKAEDGKMYEIGLKKKIGEKLKYRASFYYNDIKNYIFSDWTVQRIYNIDKAKIWGIELDGEYKIQNNLSVFANYTNQKTKKEGDRFDSLNLSDELDYYPTNKGNFGVRYSIKDKTQVALSAHYVGEQKAIYSNKLVSLPDYTVVNLTLSHVFNADKELSLYVDNLFNKKYCETIGYPMEGITYAIAYKQQF